MPSINNFFGTTKTVGKIFYQEPLKYGLRLIITQQFIDCANRDNDTLVFEAGVCDQLHESGSISYYHDAYEWCCNSKQHIQQIQSSKTNTFLPTIPTYKEEIEEEEYITDNGIKIKKCAEMIRNVENGKVWRYTWRAFIGSDKMIQIILKKLKQIEKI